MMKERQRAGDQLVHPDNALAATNEWANADSIRLADLTVENQATLIGLYRQLRELRALLAHSGLSPDQQQARLRALLAQTGTTGLLALHEYGLLTQTLPHTVERAVYSGLLSAICIILQLAQCGQLADHELPLLEQAINDYQILLEQHIIGLV